MTGEAVKVKPERTVLNFKWGAGSARTSDQKNFIERFVVTLKIIVVTSEINALATSKVMYTRNNNCTT